MYEGKGRFIVFEGLDGSGKTTQCGLLSDALTARAVPHITTKEPSGDNPVGLLLQAAMRKEIAFENETIALLFAADRVQHAAEVIQPALARGAWVLCDRYYYSGMAYQGFDDTCAYNKKVLSACRPDITFFIDLPPAECLTRLAARGGGEGLYERAEKLAQARAGFAYAFDNLPDRVLRIDAAGLTAADVAARVWEGVWLKSH